MITSTPPGSAVRSTAVLGRDRRAASSALLRRGLLAGLLGGRLRGGRLRGRPPSCVGWCFFVAAFLAGAAAPSRGASWPPPWSASSWSRTSWPRSSSPGPPWWRSWPPSWPRALAAARSSRGAFLAGAFLAAALLGLSAAGRLGRASSCRRPWWPPGPPWLRGLLRRGLRRCLAGARTAFFAAPLAARFAPRVAPPRPRRVTPCSTSTPCTKPKDRPAVSAILRMLCPDSYFLAYCAASVSRWAPVIRVPLTTLAIAPPRAGDGSDDDHRSITF